MTLYKLSDGTDVRVTPGTQLPASDRQCVLTYDEGTANVALSTTFNGGSRDSASEYSRVRSYVLSSHTGTHNLEQSHDGATWFVTATAAVSANTPSVLDVPVLARYARLQYVNGATATTSWRGAVSYAR